MKFFIPELHLSQDTILEFFSTPENPVNGMINDTASFLRHDIVTDDAFIKPASLSLRYAKTEINKLLAKYGEGIVQTEQMNSIHDGYAQLSRWRFVHQLMEAQRAAGIPSGMAIGHQEKVLMVSNNNMLKHLDPSAYTMIMGAEAMIPGTGEVSATDTTAWPTREQRWDMERRYRRLMDEHYVLPLISFLEKKMLVSLIDRNIIPADLYGLTLSISSKWYSVIQVMNDKNQPVNHIRFNGFDKPSQLSDFIRVLDRKFKDKLEELRKSLADDSLNILFVNLVALLKIHHYSLTTNNITGITLYGDPLTEKLLGENTDFSGPETKGLLNELRAFLTEQETEADEIRMELVGDHFKDVGVVTLNHRQNENKPEGVAKVTIPTLLISEDNKLVIRLMGLIKDYTHIFDSMIKADIARFLHHVLRIGDGASLELNTIQSAIGSSDYVLMDNIIELLEALLEGARLERSGDKSKRLVPESTKKRKKK